ncbi:beta-1,3-glucan-binding protein-like [Euwallacea similis]|uniref:beta-1,3-glucan-binding protein-like n=1 Tax=Euwallacea similis TaxID=1736056 RepID=UPI00344DF87B
MESLLIVLSVLCSCTFSLPQDCIPAETSVTGKSAQQPLCAGDLIFEDNFDVFDLEKWKHDITLSGGGNWEFQYYTNNRSNSYVEQGHLHIRPTLLMDDYGEKFLKSGTLDVNGAMPAGQCTDASHYGCTRTGTSTYYVNPIKSAKIKTCDSFGFTYGKVVVRAKIPSGDWLWPAVWMMPLYNSYGGWPASGEIDILEARGNKNLLDRNGVSVGTQQVGSTLHWGPFSQFNKWPSTHYEKNNKVGFDDDFHEYTLEWSSQNITFYVDDEAIGVVNPPEGGFWELGAFNQTDVENPWKGGSYMAPFDQKFYIIINLAVGGVSYFADDNFNKGGKPWKNNSTTSYRDFWKGKEQWLPTWNMENSDTHLIIDYVKVYAI